MTDGNNTIEPNTQDGQNAEPSEPKFSQADVDKIVQTRLNEEKKRQERAEKDRLAKEEEARKLATLEGEERVKAEYEAKLRESKDALAQAQRDLAITRAGSKLATLGLPVELAGNLIGATDEETDGNIAAFSKAVNDHVTKQVNAGLNHGAPPVGATDPSESWKADLDRAMGVERS